MKKYEKPILNMLSLTGSEQLCGSCAENHTLQLLYKDPDGTLAEGIDWLVGNGDGVISREELVGAFGAEETQCGAKPVIGYCKFMGSNSVAWS